MMNPVLLTKQLTELDIISIACVLIIPLLLIILGLLFTKRKLPKVNIIIGYRTSLSMKNEDTWEVANRTLGKIWRIVGLIMLLVSAISTIPFLGASEDTIGTAITIITLIQTVIIVLTIIPVEIKLRKTFDENGHRK